MKHASYSILPVSSLLLATSCAPTVATVQPPTVESLEWSAPTAPAAPRTSLGDTLGSPTLTALLDEAYRASPALLATAAQVDEAIALARSARAAGAPVVGVLTNATVARSGAFSFGNSSASLEAAFSPDFSGERRANGRAVAARVEAARNDREMRLVDAAAEIARVFVQRAALARRLALVERGMAQAKRVEQIIKLRVREGESSRLELGLQTIRVQRLDAERLRLRGALEQTRAALALLVGAEAPGFQSAPADIDSFGEPRLAVPSPAVLAATRPDLRAAEAQLRAAGGDVAAARAAFFPRIDLSAGRLAGVALTGGLNLGAALLAPIFNRGELKGNLQAVSARQRAAALNYRQAVLTALTQVETALSDSDTAASRRRVLTALRQEAVTTEGLARRRYLEGESGLQELLDAQDLIVAAEDADVLAREEQLDAAIALWRATATRAL